MAKLVDSPIGSTQLMEAFPGHGHVYYFVVNVASRGQYDIIELVRDSKGKPERDRLKAERRLDQLRQLRLL